MFFVLCVCVLMGDCSQFTQAAPLFSPHEKLNSAFHIGGDRLCFLRVRTMTGQQIRGRGAHKCLFIPPLASRWMSVSSVEHAGSLTGTKCPILLAPGTNGAILLNVSWKTKPVSSASPAGTLCPGLQGAPGTCLAC